MIRKRTLVLVLALLAVLLAAGGAFFYNKLYLAASKTAAWELTGFINTHDPSLIKEGSDWYVFYTGNRLKVLKSADGQKWNYSEPVLDQTPGWWEQAVPGHSSMDVWAPDIHFYNGKYWMYYAISSFGSRDSAIGLLSAASIRSHEWKDEGMVLKTTSADDYNAIDPNLVIDAKGQPWLAFGSWWSGIKLSKLDMQTMKPVGKLYSLATRKEGIEAPYITYHDGYYYLFVSIDKCCQGADSTYKVAVGRSKAITGPYADEKGVPMLEGGVTVLETGGDRWKGPGGQAIYENRLIVRHAYDAKDRGKSKLRINELHWNRWSGWPSY